MIVSRVDQLAASHIGITGNDLKNIFFINRFRSKVMGNLLTSSNSGVLALFIFFHEISFYASFEAYSYVFTLQTTGLWKTACDSLAQTRERHRYTDHVY